MGKFLKENWLWILAPIVIVVGGLAVLILSSSGDDQSFVYNIW